MLALFVAGAEERTRTSKGLLPLAPEASASASSATSALKISPDRNRYYTYALPALLWTLLTLFALRVIGQFAVVLGLAPFLPPMDQWQSGVMPYPMLLASQGAILAVLTAVCVQFSRGRGYFVRPRRWLATPLWVVGWIYASSMLVRYAVSMAIRPDMRWTGDLIPVVFHFVLASFLLSVAHHHRCHRVT
jgi:hypothetical protein